MDIEDYIADALEMVAAWEIEPEDLSRAVNDQARIMCGLDLEPTVDSNNLNPHTQLVF